VVEDREPGVGVGDAVDDRQVLGLERVAERRRAGEEAQEALARLDTGS
jgi:hypothetical protein